VSGDAPDCPVRPWTAATPTVVLVVEGYKHPPTTTTPTNPSIHHSKFKASDPIKVPKFNCSGLGLGRGSFLCFFVALVAWLAFFFLSFLFSKAL
jgi:hypothetical protein